MNPQSKSQRAKRLYESLREQERIPTPWFTGLLEDYIWVSRHNKAYFLDDLGLAHLDNIVDNYLALNKKIPNQIIFARDLKRIDRGFSSDIFADEVPAMFYQKPKWYQWRKRRQYRKLLVTKETK